VTSTVTTVVLDKTGTITEGRPTVTKISPDLGWDETQLLQLAASVEKYSEHPLGQAIYERSEQDEVVLLPVEKFVAEPGKGVSAMIGDQSVLIGNAEYLVSKTVDLSNIKPPKDIGTSLYIAVDNVFAGTMTISDPIKKQTVAAVERLKRMGLRVLMITGDDEAIARDVANELNIEDVLAKVLPQDKSKKVIELQNKGELVAMVGDGINDAPALTQADVGMAIGAGTDIAIECADMTLIGNSIHNVADAILISKATMRNIKQNLFGAFIYNSLGIPIAAGVLYPAFDVLLSPMIAAGAMALSSLTVVLNANRLRFI